VNISSLAYTSVIAGLALPLFVLLHGVVNQSLGADPAQVIVEETGVWAINWLVASLLIGPLNKFFKGKFISFTWLIPYRKTVGLAAFVYLTCHVIAFYVFILGADMARLTNAFTERPYIIVGIPALIIMSSMAITSNQFSQRLLKANWGRLHNLVYMALIFIWGHLLLQVRSSYWDIFFYGVVFLALFALKWFSKRKE
jgi:sulfoxide reductase heme-binding subunit YedZ